MYSASGFESGYLTFTEMCGSICGDDVCDGTCVEGNFWGIADAGNAEPSEFGLYIQEYSVAAMSSFGCPQTGLPWNPEGVSHGAPGVDEIFPAGVLGNVAAANQLPAPTTQCNPQSFSYCAAPGLLKEDDLTRRSVALRLSKEVGATGPHPESPILACGNIVRGIINPALDALPPNATMNGTGTEPGMYGCSDA